MRKEDIVVLDDKPEGAWMPPAPKIGDTVRVSLGECPYTAIDVNLVDKEVLQLDQGHPKAIQNTLGMLVNIDKSISYEHHYVVAFLHPVVDKNKFIIGGEFAAIELSTEPATINNERRKAVEAFCLLIGVNYPSIENT